MLTSSQKRNASEHSLRGCFPIPIATTSKPTVGTIIKRFHGAWYRLLTCPGAALTFPSTPSLKTSSKGSEESDRASSTSGRTLQLLSWYRRCRRLVAVRSCWGPAFLLAFLLPLPLLQISLLSLYIASSVECDVKKTARGQKAEKKLEPFKQPNLHSGKTKWTADDERYGLSVRSTHFHPQSCLM